MSNTKKVRWAILGAVFNILILAAMLVVGGRSEKLKQFIS